MDAVLGALACAEECVHKVEMYCDGRASESDLLQINRVLQSAVNAVIERYRTIQANPRDAFPRPPHQQRAPCRSRTHKAATFTAMSVALLEDRCEENIDVILGVLASAEDTAYWTRLNLEGKDNSMIEAHLALGMAVDALIKRYHVTCWANGQ